MKLLHDLAAEKRPNSSEITEAVSWALRIYRRIFTIVTQSGHLPEYFLPNMDATKARAKTKGFVKVISAFLKVIINLLETFEIPEDLFSKNFEKVLVYSRKYKKN